MTKRDVRHNARPFLITSFLIPIQKLITDN